MSNAACKEGELCKHYAADPGSSDTCQPEVLGAVSEGWDECGTNVDCEKKNIGKPVCKETMRGRLCVTERECISICASHEICDLRHQCRSPRSCSSNNDCLQDESCQRHGLDGWKYCYPTPLKDPQNTHQCGSSSDCQVLFETKTICKDVHGIRKCVRPEQCLSPCVSGQVCNGQERCLPSRSCKSALDCNPGEECEAHILGGTRTCQSAVELVAAWFECSTNEDCLRFDIGRPVCKEVSGQKRFCVPEEDCKSKCTAKEICTSEDECRAPVLCTEKAECENNEECRQFLPLGPKTCSLIPGGLTTKEQHQCGTNIDCKNFKDNQTVCKVFKGLRKCVQVAQCLADCKDTELCDCDHKCQTPTQCQSVRDCKKKEKCQQHLPENPKTCHKDDTKTPLEDQDQCGTSEDCEAKNPKKPICKEDLGKRTCVGRSQCASNCSKSEICDSNHACRRPLTCTSDKDCKFLESCRIYVPNGCKTCQLDPEMATLSLQECATNADCKKTQKKKVVCKKEI